MLIWSKNQLLQVIDGGDLDISFYASGPNHVILAADNMKTENVHKIAAEMIGDYKFCLDNRFSRFSKKLVFFELITESGDDDDDEDDNWEPNKDELEELVDMKIEDFKVSLCLGEKERCVYGYVGGVFLPRNTARKLLYVLSQTGQEIQRSLNIISSVRVNLEKSVQLQNLVKMFEARDRNVQENNFERVNWWSCVFLIVMISVGVTQVVMIRNLFADKASKAAQTMKVRT